MDKDVDGTLDWTLKENERSFPTWIWQKNSQPNVRWIDWARTE